MKYEKRQMNKSDKYQYFLIIGKAESKLLLQVLRQAHRYTPKTNETMPTIHRIANMKNELQKMLYEMPEDITHSNEGGEEK